MKLPIDETQAPIDLVASEAPVSEKKRRRRNERNAAAYDDDVCELLKAVDEWRRKSGRTYPAWSETLQLLKNLGWRKVGKEVEPAPAPVEPMAPEKAAKR